jgi:hypothetical protein
MTRLPRILLCLIVSTLLLAACATQTGSVSPSADPSRPVRTEPPLVTIPPSEEPVTGEVPAEILANLVADASDRAGVDTTAVEVVRAESVTWSDGSLDCPEPGMSYTQALVDGYHVILQAGAEELDYRVTVDGGFRLCEGGRPGG